MRFASLGSGSSGNAMVIEAGRTRVLLDCGFGPRQLAARLARLQLTMDDVDAVVVTHEHSDHASGLAAWSRRASAVFSSHGTAVAAGFDRRMATIVGDGQPIAIGDIEVHPFSVPHDAREPLQFAFTDGVRRLGVLTDAGCVTPHMVAMLLACNAIVIECNHDADLLATGNYPQYLKKRIASRYGHLDNGAAADLLARLNGGRLQHVVAAHLSRENNTPDLARNALAAVLNCRPDWIGVADQDAGFDWRQIV